MDYYKYEISTKLENNEVLIALLSLCPFDTFVETDRGFEAYIPSNKKDDEIEKYLLELKGKHFFDYSVELIKGTNWNEEWESNFHPIRIGKFCGIRAEFHPCMNEVQFELIITPKMAFGTGHHETTSMVITLMEYLDFTNELVLDYGCGTGVLAILASKLGAKEIDAVDIEHASYLNTMENCVTNEATNVNALQGDINTVIGKPYGIVLANINRNVILDSMKALSSMVKRGGILILSGFVIEDEPIMNEAIDTAGFEIQKVVSKNNWLAMQCVRN